MKPFALPLALVLGLALATPGQAAPPPNDNFAGATALGTPPTQVTGDNTEATTETNEPAAHGEQSVWWKWTATATGRYRAEVCATLPSADLVVEVYTGSSVASLTNVTAAGGSGPVRYDTGRCEDGGLSAVAFDATAGQAYYIAVGADSCCTPASPNIVLKLFKTAVNDNFAEAATVPSVPAEMTGDNTFATRENFEPSEHGEASIWWKWTADRAGRFRADICATLPSADLQMAVYTGSAVNALTSMTAAGTSNTDAPLAYAWGRCEDGGHPALVFDAVVGQTYYFAVGADSCCTYTSPNIVFKLFKSEANDNLAEALPLAGHYGTGRGSNVFASVQQFEPDDHGDASIWWVWRAPQSGPFMVHTCRTLPEASTLPRIYTGSGIGSLRAVKAEVTSCSRRSGQTARFTATEGQVYFFAVGADSCCTTTSPGVVLSLRDRDCDQTTRAFKKAKKKFKKARKRFRKAKRTARRMPTARKLKQRAKAEKRMGKKKRVVKRKRRARKVAC